MGCKGSKVEQPLVTLCRQRKELIRAAADHRYALAAAHLAYFHSLIDVGDALCRFVEEELVLSSTSSSPSTLSPVLTLPSDESKTAKNKKKKKKNKKSKNGMMVKTSSSSPSISHTDSKENKEEEGSHLHLSSSDSEVVDCIASSSSSGHIEIEDAGEEKNRPSPKPGISFSPTHAEFPFPSYNFNSYDPYFNPNSYNPNDFPSSSYNNSGHYPNYPYNSYVNSYGSNAYYMKKSKTAIPSVIYEEPKQNTIYMYSGYPNEGNYPSNGNYPGNGGNFGFMMNSIPQKEGGNGTRQQQPQPQSLQPQPPSPKASAWDYLNPFEMFDNSAYPGYFSQHTYGNGSNTSSPDSREVREREGIPELEEETESEVTREPTFKEMNKVHEDFALNKNKNKNVQFDMGKGNNFGKNVRIDEGEGHNLGKGTSKGVKLQPPHMEEAQPVEIKEVQSSTSPETDTSVSLSTEEMSVNNNGVSFKGDVGVPHDTGGSSKPSSFTTLSAHGTRDLREVVREIKDEFEAATNYGKEVSLLLEVGKEPYHSTGTLFRVILARILYSVAPSLSSSHHPPVPLRSSHGKMAREYPGSTENGLSFHSLASTLDRLYLWEKKLYNEVKDEEKLRVKYEKQCKKLKNLDDLGAEAGKIEAAQSSVRKLLTKLNVSIRAVDAISSKIHELRDEELLPQLRELIYGLRRMWKLMLKSHQKQFQAILESKTRVLRAKTGLHRDSNLRATMELEVELMKWCERFNNWIEEQRSYADSLNGWLLRCLLHEPEETPDGPVPFSPGHIGAPPVFVICHDWRQAMERISESQVKTTMDDFATNLHQLLERQDEEQHRILKTENLLKDFEKQIRARRMERASMQHEHDALSEKNLSMVESDNGISALDDLKVDLDSMRQRVRKERAGHKEAVNLVHDAVSRTIQAGLIPIFEALENFSSEALKAFEDVRVENADGNS